MTTLGELLLAISTLGALVSIALLVFGHMGGPKDGEKLTNAGYIATFVVFLTTTAAVLLLLVGFFTKDFRLLYVVENHSRDVSNLSWLYSISALWAGREGSLLFWEWILSGFAAFMAYKRLSVTDAVSNIGIAVMNFVQIFFLVALFFDTNNPFKATPAVAFSGGQLTGDYALQGMNPLLQHWAMILHPPTLFIGYAGLTIPFAFAIAALIVGDGSKLWVEIVDRVSVFSWLMLGIGIGLGAVWAYVVLGWGGYWGWDPVENASLLPWLTGVGLLHSFTVYRRRGGFKKWAVMMSAVSFTLVLLGTFITRSGVIQSVHAFGEDPLSKWWFLGMMVLSLAVPAVLLLFRSEQFKGADEFTSLMSKEGSYYFNNVLMLFAAFLVAGLTMSPALAGPTFNGASFDLLARPVGILYVLLMAVCPILSWNATSPETFWKRAKWPLGIAAVLGAGLLVIWATVLLPNYQGSATTLPALASIQGPLDHVEGIIGLLVAALAIALPLYLFYDGSRKRAAARGESIGTAFMSIMFKSRTQSGGYLTHLGIGIVLVGLVGSAMYVQDVPMTVQDKPGTKLAWTQDNTAHPNWKPNLGGIEFVYQGVSSQTLANGDVVQTVKLDLVKNGATIGQMTPSVTQLANRAQNQSSRFNATLRSTVLGDIFVAFQGGDTSGLSFDVKINPLISWAWFGFGLLVIGTVIAAWPRKELPLAAVPAPKGKSPASGSRKKK
jgi:cytochrome c-type biogenesis protein CcmF